MNLPPTSRYYAIEQKTLELSDGTSLPYLGRRIVPLPDRFVTLEIHIVVQGERPDPVAYQFLGDAEQYWRICDANSVLQPEELTARPGSQIRITLPEGIPGPSNA